MAIVNNKQVVPYTEFYIKLGDRVHAKAYLENTEHELSEFEGKDSKEVI